MRFHRMLIFAVTAVITTGQILTTATASDSSTPTSDAAIWLTDSGLTQNARELISNVTQVGREGLSPDTYYASVLQGIVKSNGKAFPKDVINKLMDRAFHKLANDLSSGTVNPREVQKEWYRDAPRVDTAKLLDFIKQGRIGVNGAFATIRPQHASYSKLGQALARLETETLPWPVISKGEALKLGQNNPRVVELRQRLIASGDLSIAESANSVFDQALHDAVISFQKRHGLVEDGVVAKTTLRELNVSLDDRIDQIKLNLERMRWMTRDTAKQGTTAKIVVNIPEFKLRMFNAGAEIFELPVVTGKPKHQTPVFSETMKKIVVAPTWIVPTSITNDELIPLELKNPGYLKKEKIGFYRWSSGKLLPVSKNAVTRETFHQKPFPYVLQQSAGEENVLGRVKFLMPNKHSIYLHDTSARKLFKKTRRAFSHGCIRVSSPEMLGSVLLQMDGYNQTETKDLLAKEKTTTVKLKTPIPTHLVYYTSWVDNDGVLQFREDIYKQDKRLTSALKKREKVRIAQAMKLTQPVMAAALPAANN